MNRFLGVFAVSALAMTGLLVSATAQPPKKGDKAGGKGKAFPKFEPGRVLPPFIRGELELTEDQERQIKELERTVKQQLERILTREQWKKLSELPGKGPKAPPPGDPGDASPDQGKDKDKGKDKGKGPLELERAAVRGGIQWFATWESGVREARRSGRPILLVSAAPHCAGVSGVW